MLQIKTFNAKKTLGPGAAPAVSVKRNDENLVHWKPKNNCKIGFEKDVK
jgi:hypothetical protein